jgi:hypothetical protein
MDGKGEICTMWRRYAKCMKILIHRKELHSPDGNCQVVIDIKNIYPIRIYNNKMSQNRGKGLIVLLILTKFGAK